MRRGTPAAGTPRFASSTTTTTFILLEFCSTPDLEIYVLLLFFLLLGNLMRHTIFLSYTFPHSPCKNKRRTSTSFDIRDLVKKEFSRDLSCPRQECGSVVQATTMWRRRSSNSPSSSFTDSTNLIVITPCYQPSSGYLVPFVSSRCAPLDLCNHFIFTLPN